MRCMTDWKGILVGFIGKARRLVRESFSLPLYTLRDSFFFLFSMLAKILTLEGVFCSWNGHYRRRLICSTRTVQEVMLTNR